MALPAPTEIWSPVCGLRSKILTAVSEEPALRTTLLTSPLAEVVVPAAERGIVTPEIEKSNSVDDTKCGFETLLLKSETWLSMVNRTPVG